MKVFFIAHYNGSALKQIGGIFEKYYSAEKELRKAVAAYNGYDNPDDMPDLETPLGEWKQDGHIWKIFGNTEI